MSQLDQGRQQLDDDEDRDRRTRTLSEKREDLYNFEKGKYLAKQVKLWTEVDSLLQSYSSCLENKRAWKHHVPS